MTLSLVATVVVLLDSAYDSVTANADASARQLALAVEREIVRNVDLIDLSVQAVVDGVQQPSVMQLPPLIRNQFLFSRAAAARYIQQISVFDSHGHLFINSLELQDSTTLQALRLSDTNSPSHSFDNEVQVGHPYLAGHGTRLVEFWRPIQAPTGQGSGLVTATVDLSYFSEIFNSLNITPGTSIKLVLEDRTTLIDNQNPVDPINLNRPTDDPRFLSHIARILRLPTDHDFTAKRAVPGTSLMVTILLPAHVVYADWLQRAGQILSYTAAISLLFVSISVYLTHTMRMRARADAENIRLASVDDLTDLPNRRALNKVYLQALKRAKRYQEPMALMFVDVDHFKRYNDHYGHVAGDKALQAVAGALKAVARANGLFVGRYGGEEFVAILANVNQQDALHIAHTVRGHIRSLNLAHAKTELGILTASVGLACYNQDTDMHVDDSLMKRADLALYSAKSDGRDRVGYAV